MLLVHVFSFIYVRQDELALLDKTNFHYSLAIYLTSADSRARMKFSSLNFYRRIIQSPLDASLLLNL